MRRINRVRCMVAPRVVMLTVSLPAYSQLSPSREDAMNSPNHDSSSSSSAEALHHHIRRMVGLDPYEAHRVATPLTPATLQQPRDSLSCSWPTRPGDAQ